MIHRHQQITSVTIQELFFAIYDVIFGKICIKLDKDPALRKWWAQYQEFCGEFEQAEKFYQQCQDYLSLVRVFCCLEKIEEADKLANETGDYAACYHMARHHESGKADDVINLRNRDI